MAQELKTYDFPVDGDFTATVELFYLKSEADKVIAELEESHKKEVSQLLIEIEELKKQVHDYAQGLYVMQAWGEKESRHQKYKRCFKMARWCISMMVFNSKYGTDKKWHLFKKWHKHWLELAEEFKEAK